MEGRGQGYTPLGQCQNGVGKGASIKSRLPVRQDKREVGELSGLMERIHKGKRGREDQMVCSFTDGHLFS